MPVKDLTTAAVDLYLALLAVVVLLADLFLPARLRKEKVIITVAGLLLGLVPVATLWRLDPASEFSGAYLLDGFALFFKVLFLVGGALVAVLSYDYLRNLARGFGSYLFLLVVVILGCSLLASANDLIVVYIAFEMISLSSYILAGYLRFDRRSNEAGLKYFLFGAAASAVMLYGFSWLYGLGQSTNMTEISQNLALGLQSGSGLLAFSPAGVAALVLILVGLGYKIAMAPFQAWVPDVYEGAPTPVTAFLSIAPKAAGFAFLLRLLGPVGTYLMPMWPEVLAVFAVLTMFAGNLMALPQTNIKRMLAYSSVAHAGYLLIGVVVYTRGGFNLSALLYYLVAYLVMNLGAFAVATLVERNTGRQMISDYAGLARGEPLVAALMTLFLLSLIGIPPTAGFVGKLLIFGAALRTPPWGWLAIVGIINAVISVYYYMNIVREMYFGRGRERQLPVRPASVMIIIVLLAIAVLVLGLIPNLVMPAAGDMARFLWSG
ncbi:MAG TPA: NADH-quinone oxidoreductase subunit N [Armatimonadota bacterium]|jgi:proton-translocating NADH-quinone oxidoreductase chain N